MKKTDIAMIILVIAFGIGAGYLVASNISFLKVPEEGVEVRTIGEISSEISQPSDEIFNSNAINPTVEVFVGQKAD